MGHHLISSPFAACNNVWAGMAAFNFISLPIETCGSAVFLYIMFRYYQQSRPSRSKNVHPPRINRRQTGLTSPHQVELALSQGGDRISTYEGSGQKYGDMKDIPWPQDAQDFDPARSHRNKTGRGDSIHGRASAY